MREDVLGLELSAALEVLRREGIEPQVTMTAAPKKADREGVIRVVFASDDAKTIVASCFVDPLSCAQAAE